MGVTLTVYFDDPFWVGVFERMDGGKLSACKVTFGAEPKDYDMGIQYQYRRLQNCHPNVTSFDVGEAAVSLSCSHQTKRGYRPWKC